MPDPLSVTVGVVSLVATVTKLLHTVNTYHSQYKLQDLSAISIKVQCDCILVALAQIQAALLSNQQVSARLTCEDSFSGQRLRAVLGACELTFAVLVGRLSKLTARLENGVGLLSRREKIEQLWKESDIVELSQNISRISDGLNLLLTAFNMKSQLEVQQVLTSSRASIILDQVADDASSIYLSDCNASYISDTIALREQDPMLHSEIDPKGFTFDQEVLMTPAYRKVQISHPNPRSTAATPSSSTGQNKQNRDCAARPIPKKQLQASCKVASVQTKENPSIPSGPALTAGDNTRVGIASCQLSVNAESLEPPPTEETPGPLTRPPVIELVLSESNSLLLNSENIAVPQTRALHAEGPLPNLVNYEAKGDDGVGQTGDQSSAEILVSDHPSSLSGIENCAIPGNHLDNAVLVSDLEHQFEQVELPRKVTLRDFMPKSSSLITDVDSIQQSNRSQHRHNLYVTPTEINISGLGMTEIAENAVKLVLNTIESLFLYDNNISTLPKSIAMCRNLTYLNLKANNLDKFPLEICAIVSLKTLHVSQNNIPDLPTDLANIHNLEFLDIAFNCLPHLPHFLAFMDKLTTIYAQGNPFIDPALQMWGQLHSNYSWDPEYSKIVTQGLKAVINNSLSPITSYALPVTPCQTSRMIDESDPGSLPYLPPEPFSDMWL